MKVKAKQQGGERLGEGVEAPEALSLISGVRAGQEETWCGGGLMELCLSDPAVLSV